MNNKKLQAIIEGLLFISGDDGISARDLYDILDEEKPSAIKSAITDLNEKFAKDESSPFSIQFYAGNRYRLQTKPELHEYFAKLSMIDHQNRLSNAAIEVLSIIAYKGPITKSKIDEIRNSDSAYQLQKLKDKKLIQATGKADEIGRPNIYQITDNFFKIFNLNGKEEMPEIDLDDIVTSEMMVEVQKEQDEKEVKDIFGGEIIDD